MLKTHPTHTACRIYNLKTPGMGRKQPLTYIVHTTSNCKVITLESVKATDCKCSSVKVTWKLTKNAHILSFIEFIAGNSESWL